MSSSLGGIDISGLQLTEAWDIGIDSVSEVASAGNKIVYERDRSYTDMLLIGGDNWGSLKQGIISQLKVIASVKGGVYTLMYEGTSYQVRFKTEDQPVIDSQTIGNPVVTTDATYHNNIVLKLMGE